MKLWPRRTQPTQPPYTTTWDQCHCGNVKIYDEPAVTSHGVNGVWPWEAGSPE